MNGIKKLGCLMLILEIGYSTSAWSARVPQVGDWRKVSITEYGQFGIKQRILETLVEVQCPSNASKLQIAVTFNGGTIRMCEYSADLMYVADTVAFCQSMINNGRQAQLEFIPTAARDFYACRVTDYTTTYWYSDEVPFGLVKGEDRRTGDPGTIYRSFEITEFSWGTGPK